MLLVKKLRGRGRINAVAPGKLIQLEDQLSQRRFLVDSGAAYSLLPFQSAAKATGPVLVAANNEEIPCWGERSVEVMFHGRRFTWQFLLADVSQPILGMDFVRGFNLLIDAAGNRLWDAQSWQSFDAVAAVAAHPVHGEALIAGPDTVEALISGGTHQRRHSSVEALISGGTHQRRRSSEEALISGGTHQRRHSSVEALLSGGTHQGRHSSQGPDDGWVAITATARAASPLMAEAAKLPPDRAEWPPWPPPTDQATNPGMAKAARLPPDRAGQTPWPPPPDQAMWLPWQEGRYGHR